MKKLLCFGDSNTWGYIPGGKGRFARDTRWTGRLDSLLAPFGWSVVEEGLCGRTTIFDDERRPDRNGSHLLPSLLEEHNPDAIFIMLGTNDCKTYNHSDATLITRGMQELLDQVEEYNRASILRRNGAPIPVVIASPIFIRSGIHATDEEFDESAVAISEGLPSSYRKLAVSYGAGFIAASDFVLASKVDNEHMNANGHRRFAFAMREYLLKSKILGNFDLQIKQVS